MDYRNLLKRVAILSLSGMMLWSAVPVQAEEGDIPLDAAHFPDENFREDIKRQFDRDHNGVLSQKELGDVKKIIVSSEKTVTDLTGIEYFKSLEELACAQNQIENLDLSQNPAIKRVDCHENKITNLNVTGCKELEYIQCKDNELSELDVSTNTKLNNLGVEENQLKSLDLSQNAELQMLFCDRNELTELDLSNNSKLTNLVCQYNHFATLDLMNNTNLNILYTYGQNISVEAQQKDGKWVVPMKQYAGKGDLSRIGVWDEGFSYDAATGYLTLPDSKPEMFEYTYKSTDKKFAEADIEYMWVDAHVTYKEKSQMPFEDVRKGDWFYDYVEYVYDNQLMTGLNTTTFGPGQPLARAQFAVILHRMEGTPAVEYVGKFPDVLPGQWYTDAVEWASNTGVVTGYTDSGLFGTGDNINREQMAVMMYRFAEYKGFDVSEKADFGKFADASNVNAFAKDAMQWAVGTGIISGKDNGTRIDPQGNAARAECATIIMRFREYYGL